VGRRTASTGGGGSRPLGLGLEELEGAMRQVHPPVALQRASGPSHRGVDVLAVVLLGESRPPVGPGVAREVGAATRLQHRQRRVAWPEQKGDAPQLSAVLEPRGGELEPLEAAEDEDDGEAESPRGEAGCHQEPKGVGVVAMVHDWGRDFHKSLERSTSK
jgi:hypothetical protein